MNPWLILRVASLLVSTASVYLSFQIFSDKKRRFDQYVKPDKTIEEREKEELLRRQHIQKYLEKEWKNNQ